MQIDRHTRGVAAAAAAQPAAPHAAASPRIAQAPAGAPRVPADANPGAGGQPDDLESVDPREAEILHDAGFEEAQGEALTLDDIAASLPPSRDAVVPLEASAPFVPLRPVALGALRPPLAERAVLDREENRPRLRAVRRSGPPQPVPAGPSRRRAAGRVAPLHPEVRPSLDARQRRNP